MAAGGCLDEDGPCYDLIGLVGAAGSETSSVKICLALDFYDPAIIRWFGGTPIAMCDTSHFQM